MKFQIRDFCDVHCVEVEPWHNKGDKLVLITQRAGSLSFQHTMRPDQARYMAAALQMAAEQAENLVEPNSAPAIAHLPSDDTEGGGV